MGIDNARFRRPVVPGHRLQLEIEVLRHKGAVWKQKGTATVDGQTVAEGEFLATMVDREHTAGGK
jgi:3-hydroxyacyl-[acyl-carrier-protein] dehydratase